MGSMTTLYRQVRLLESRFPSLNLAVLTGAIATAFVTHGLLLVREGVEFEPFRQSLWAAFGVWLRYDPFTSLPLLGGLVGGYIAGYLTRGAWYQSLINAVLGVLGGLALFYAVVLVLAIGRFALYSGFNSTMLIFEVFHPLVYVVTPFGFIYGVQCFFAGPAGYYAAKIGRLLVGSADADDGKVRPVRLRERVAWAGFGAVVLVVGFLASWGLLYYVSEFIFRPGL